MTVQVFTSQPGTELLVHGVAVAQGKPFTLMRTGKKNLLGLPGQEGLKARTKVTVLTWPSGG